MVTVDEVVREFLVESHENLDRLDREFVALEADPGDRAKISEIFRTIHTIKGTCGFLGFRHLEALTHAGETLLSGLRDGDLALTPEITSALLTMVDRVRAMLRDVEATGTDGEGGHEALASRLVGLRTGVPSAPAPSAAPQAEQAAPEPEHPRADDGPTAADMNVRVDVGLLDKLMNLVGELVLVRNQVQQVGARFEDPSFAGAAQRLSLITTELQEHVMKTRMQPINNLWNKLPRVVRDLAVTCGKQVRVEMIGKETELDRTILEAIKDPLVHMVRNSVDHGIEAPEVRVARGKARTGTLRLRAFHEGGQVNIEVSDDGKGLDLDAIRRKAAERGLVPADRIGRMSDFELVQLVFEPGFSTAEKVSNVSGRGVGMDVVRTHIERIGGTIELESLAGQGTTARIRIPLTLAIIPALVVTAAGQRYAIPQVSLVELVHLDAEDARTSIRDLRGAPVYRLRGRLLPLVFLTDVLEGRPRSARTDAELRAVNIVVVHADDRQLGFVVDAVHDTEEIVVKPLGKELKGLAMFAGATIMGDGRVSLIIDVAGLAHHTGALRRNAERASKADSSTAIRGETGTQTLVLFEVAAGETMAVPLSMVARLEEFPASAIEQIGRTRVVQYRGQILPLYEVSDRIESTADTVHAVVYSDGNRSVGLVVGRIVDIVEEKITIDRSLAGSGALGAAVVQGRVTSVLDASGVIRRHDPAFLHGEA